MSEVDLSQANNQSSCSLKYLPTADGDAVAVNKNYMLGFFVSRLSILDSAVKTGDVIRFKTDYGKGNKTLSFTKPVVIGDQLFVDGEVSVNQELELYFNGVTWQDSCFSSAPVLDVGVMEISTSKILTPSDFVNTTFDKPILIVIEMVGGCGGSRYHATPAQAQSGAGGGGAGYGAIEFVVSQGDLFPKIDFIAGADGLRDRTYNSKDATSGTNSTLTVNDILTLDCQGGKIAVWGDKESIALGGEAHYHEGFPVIYHEVVHGNNSTQPQQASEVISCKYRTIPSATDNNYLIGKGGFTALGTRAHSGARYTGAIHPNGKLQITYRPATADEIAAQEAANA